ncbi:MAG: CHAT domain-containing protein, partial [Planctomycetota bacterium]
ATHGFALSEPGTRGFGRTAPARESVPLALSARDAPLFSGLALAGANRAAEAREGADGILTAEELSSLALDSVEWVVLSSCKSASGTSRGASSREGLFGLPRALRIAGAHTVIASLFPVEDALVPTWMAELYRARFEQRCDSPTAVRRASLALLTKLRAEGRSTHPRGWGGFLCTGNWR